MKNKRMNIIYLVFGITLFMSNSSFAQSQDRQQKTPPTFSELIEKMDENEDGKLAKEELKGPLKENFTSVDTDEDGFITEEEFEKAPKPKRRERNK